MRLSAMVLALSQIVVSADGVQGGLFEQYNVTKIAESAQFRLLESQRPQLNDLGTVAFQAELANGHNTIFIGNGEALTPLYERGQSPYNTRPVLIGCQQLTNQNEVVFWGDVNTKRIVLASSSTVRSLYDTYTTGNSAKDLTSIDMYPAISSDSGRVVFVGTGQQDALFQGDVNSTWPAVRVGYADPPYFKRIVGPTVANDGTVAFSGTLWNGVRSGIFLQRPGGPLVTVADPSDFVEVRNAKINNPGDVIFSASTTSGLSSLYLYHAGNTTKLVDSDGYFAAMDTAINDNGKYVFQGWDSQYRASAIYSGPDRVADRIIGSGDSFFGEQIDSVYLGGLNDVGQIAFYAHTRGRGGIFLATPFSAFPTFSLPSGPVSLRVMRDSHALPGSASIAVVAPGAVGGDFTLSTSSSLVVTPSSGTVAAGMTAPTPVSFGWSDTSAVGARSGLITVTNVDNPTDPNDHQMSVNGAVVANRQVMVAPVGGGRSLRVMVANPLATTTTVRSGADPVAEDDNHATRVNTVAGGAATDGYATVRYQGSPRSTFNGANQNASLGISFARDSQPGSHHGVLDLASTLLSDGEDASVGAAVESAVLDYDVSVLANRQLTVGSLGTAGQPARVVLRCPRTTTISTGNDPLLDSDAAATRVNTVANGRASATDFNRMLVTYHGTPRAQFNAAGQSAEIDVLFNKTGRVKTTYDLSHELLKNGEADSVGAALQSANLSLDVNILTPRRLTATQRTVNFGNVLRGASVAGAFTLKTADSHPDSDHATMVYVAPGGTPLGELTAAQTFVSGGGTVKVPVTGRLSTYGNGVTKGTLPVATAEAPEVQDTTRYKGLAVQYKANVGLAKVGRSASFGSGETVLSASVADGAQLASFAAGESLSSKVKPKGTLAENPSLATSITTTASLKGIYSGVGSEAEIVDSTAVDAGTTVTMQWRSRSRSESHAPRTPVDSALPSGAWLASDVVKISGIASSVTYALNMSFDNRINLALDGPVNGTVENEFSSGHLYLTEYDNAARRWLNAGEGGGNFESLADFLTDHSGTPLTDLVGSWGVDPLTSATGIGHAWAIVAGGGSGVFAVDPGIGGVMTANVPEPSVIALLISAVAALGAFRATARKTG